LFPAPEYPYKPALTHEVAYGAPPFEQRKALHARLVSVIDRMAPGRLGEQVDRLAHHALQGGLWDQALILFRKAGAKAAGRCAYREAAACFQQGLEALEHLPEGPARSEQAVDLRFDLHNALIPLGDVGKMLTALEEAEQVAVALEDQRRLGQVAAYMTQCFWWMGKPEQAVASAQRALAIGQTLGDRAL